MTEKRSVTIKDHEDKNAKIFLPKEIISKETFNQVIEYAENETFHNIRIMPDCHTSKGCCVGLTSLIIDKVIPNVVGGDIGCGINCYPLNRKINSNEYKELDIKVKNLIPVGYKIHNTSMITNNDWEYSYEKCNDQVKNLQSYFPNITLPVFDSTYYTNLINKISNDESEKERFINSIGTLGGGNHFIEFQKDDDDNYYITVHSGSRSIGQSICNYHQNKLNITKRDKKKNNYKPYLKEEEMFDYLIDMIFAQNLASLNREIIIRIICENINELWDKNKIIETVHNYIDFNRMILRKGAISAEKGEKCIIALNMKDGILLCEGKGNEEWNYSTAHGCGRVMSRTKAKKNLQLDIFIDEMKDVYSSTICKETIDESPMAYKDIKLIVK